MTQPICAFFVRHGPEQARRLRMLAIDARLATFQPHAKPKRLTPLSRLFWGLSGAILGLFLASAPLLAQNAPCGPREALREWLSDSYGEVLRAVMMDRNGARVELWANEARQTWTLTSTSAIGVACILGAGTGVAVLPEHENKETF